MPADDVTHWARNGNVNIAYKVLGAGPMDLVFVTGLVSHIEVMLEEPGLRRWFDRLGRIARVVLVDRRGSGLSDPLTGPLSLEEEADDVAAVLDAVGSDRAVLQAYASGGPLAITFGCRHPERTLALVLYASMVRTLRDPEDGFEWADPPELRQRRIDDLVAAWGTGSNAEVMAPSAAGDPTLRAWLARMERLSMTPAGVERLARNLADVDVRPLLGSLRVPTLVLHRTDDQLIDVRHSRYLAEHVPGARYVEVPGRDSLPMIGDTEALLGEIEEFLTGGRASGMDRELLTVLFTDVVDATRRAAGMGDGRWRDLLSSHDEVVRAAVARFGGREVKTIGDGFLVTFEGPPSQAVRCARAVTAGVRALGLEVRCGLHTGECEHLGEDVGGMAVHIAARVCALAAPGEVLASGTVYGTVVGSGLEWEDRGSEHLRGVPGQWPLFALA
jgi:class 3 adenylate cyclase/alpha-beta hydrolase superfamily lysophospholipase